MKIRWVSLALTDIEQAADFISKDNPEAARKMVRRIWEAAKLLAEHPDAGDAEEIGHHDGQVDPMNAHVSDSVCG